MPPQHPSRARLFPLVFLFLLPVLLVPALPLSAQSVLLAVREAVGGKPIAPPLPVREGLAGGIFDAGFIVIDFPGSKPATTSEELASIARSGGADLILEVTVDYNDTVINANLIRISGHGVFTLTDAATRAVLAKGEEEASNKDRERDIDRNALGQELGRLLAVRVGKYLADITAGP